MNILLTVGRWLIGNDFARAIVLKAVRHALTACGPLLTAWLLRHGADAGATGTFVADASGTVLSATGVVFSMIDAGSVSGQIRAAEKSAAQAAIARADAAAPKTNAAVDARLEAHSV